MGLFNRGPDTMELLQVAKMLGVFYTLPRSELVHSRKDWVREWRATRISAAHFLVERYGMGVTEEGEVVPTRGAALVAPLYWDLRDGFDGSRAARFIRDVQSGRIPRTTS